MTRIIWTSVWPTVITLAIVLIGSGPRSMSPLGWLATFIASIAICNYQAGAEFVLPVHHRTFKLSNEPYNEPIERLLLASGSSEDRIAVREIGEEFHLA